MQKDIHRNWRDLIKPKRLAVDKDTLTPKYGKFFAEPLERGFGITIGNALRRVLLSSLQGAAVTSVRIEGALHEFTSLPGITEDVADIILNIKDVLLKMASHETKTMRLDKKGPCIVRAADIEAPDGIEILNPDRTIATGRRGRSPQDGDDLPQGSRLCAGGAEQDAEHADRLHPDRRHLFAGQEGQLPRDQRARGPADRL